MSVGLFNTVALAYVLLLHAPAIVVPKPIEVEAVASIKIEKKREWLIIEHSIDPISNP